MIRTLTAFAGLAAAGVAQAAFVGGVIRVDAAASAAASAEIGSAVTVTRMFMAFDEADDILISVGNASFSGVADLFQTDFGADFAGGINPAFFAITDAEWDSYVGIGGPHFSTSPFGGDTDPDFAFSANGIASGGWFGTPSGDLVFPGTSTLGTSGLFEVFAGQFVLQGDFTGAARGTSDVGDGFIASDLFSGLIADGNGLTVNWVDQQGGDNNGNRVDVRQIPAPGAAALFGLAGFTASRRRRG